MQDPSPPASPIIVSIVEENEIAGLGDTLFQAVGLTGAIALGALIVGVLLAALVIGYRRIRTRLEPENADVQTQPLGLTPTTKD